MLQSIRDFFEQHLAAPPDRAAAAHTVELATAALLIEVVRCDAGITAAERAAVERTIDARFGLSAAEASALITLAEDEVRQANDFFQFTSLINRHFTQPQKIDVIEAMWRAALADGELSAHEQHVLRRVAELLHVAHGDYIAAKLRARAATGSDVA